MTKDNPTIVKRGRMTYVLYPEKVIVGIGDYQWLSYNQYDNWNRQGITAFRKSVLASKEDELSSPIDQMSLAYRCGIKSSGTQKPKGLDL